ncbi:PREDICTED: putative defensin-like protein 283 [Camelina sativa]|uniref:Defensin-like protein 283 n=2 Tax=Camelina sativa TaxID=90675 RepID=A0ABM1QMY7_CAMSA|nr:PREDICTED: putative defensin-like protein 283 [Camelina sativa]
MTKISFSLVMTVATIYIIVSHGLLVTAARESLHHQCFCESSSPCACTPPPPTPTPPTAMNKSGKDVGPLCLSDGDCKQFCRPKKGVCNIDFETCICN